VVDVPGVLYVFKNKLADLSKMGRVIADNNPAPPYPMLWVGVGQTNSLLSTCGAARGATSRSL
jgi:hypothetical protein